MKETTGLLMNSSPSTTPIWAPSFKKTNTHIVDILRRTWAPILVLATVMFPFAQFFEYMTNHPDQVPNGQMLGPVGSLLIAVFYSVTFLLIAPLRIRESLLNRPNSSLSDFAQRHFNRLLVENLRAIASILLWTLALIIPGVYRQLRLYFVSYVVFFDKEKNIQFQQGNTNFLTESYGLAPVSIDKVAEKKAREKYGNQSEETTTIEFDEYFHDFGKVFKGSSNKHVFRFKNIGSVPCTIQSAKASCGCTIPKKPEKPVLPGEYGELEVVFKPKDSQVGTEVKKTVTVVANTIPNPIKLDIKSFATGVYFVKIQSDQKSFVQKLVKE